MLEIIKKQKILFVIFISKIFPIIKLIYTISPLKSCGKMLPSYEWHILLFLCCGTEALFSPGRILTTIPHPSQARLDLEAPADLKPQPPGPPATASFPNSISLVTERDK